MDKTPRAITASVLLLAAALLGSAQAATVHSAARAGAHRHAGAPLPLHERVVEARAAEQRRWIAAGQRHHRLDAAQAASLREAVARIEHDQRALLARGGESVTEALALSHRQDLLDWAIRSGRVDFEPQRIAALDAAA